MSNNKNYQSFVPKVKYKLLAVEQMALKEIGRYLLKKARELVPVDTGKLRRNISYRIFRKTKSVQLGVRRKGFYALFLEKGTSKMTAKPFLTPAAEQNIEEIRLIAGKYIKEIETENAYSGIVSEYWESEE